MPFAIHPSTVVFQYKLICREGTATCLACGAVILRADIEGHKCKFVPEWVSEVVRQRAEARRLRYVRSK